MKRQKFTVIIPTRERAEVLAKAMETVLAQDYDNLEIVVSDNFSSDRTRELVHSFADPRIRYYNTGSRVSMSANWEFALGKVREGWVTILGDDDGLMPGCISEAAEIVAGGEVDALMSNCCFYHWPSYTGKSHGALSIPLMEGCETRDAKLWVIKLLRGRATYARLPMIYTGGFVHRRAIDRVMDRSGRFFNAAAPDVYSAIAVSSVIDRYAYSYKPLVVTGVSKFSSGSNLFKKDRDQTAVRQFFSEKNIPVHSAYDVFGPDRFAPSILGVVYESYMQAREFFPGLPDIDMRTQLTNILAFERRWSDELRAWTPRFAAKHGLDFGAVSLRARAALPSLVAQGVFRRLVRALYYEVIDSGGIAIPDVAQAARLAAEVLRNGTRKPIASFVRYSAW